MRLIQDYTGIELLRKAQIIRCFRKTIACQTVDQFTYLCLCQVPQIYEAVEQRALGWRQPLQVI